MTDHFTDPIASALRDHALTFPETTEGSSCVNRAFKVRKKNFLFVGEKEDGSCKVMLKLGPSLGEAGGLDEGVDLGSNGWTTIRFAAADRPDLDRLRRWVDESYRLLAPKSLIRLL